MFAAFVVSSILTVSYIGVSLAVLDRTLGHVDGIDDRVKNVGDDVTELEHILGDSVDNAGENVSDIWRDED